MQLQVAYKRMAALKKNVTLTIALNNLKRRSTYQLISFTRRAINIFQTSKYWATVTIYFPVPYTKAPL